MVIARWLKRSEIVSVGLGELVLVARCRIRFGPRVRRAWCRRSHSYALRKNILEGSKSPPCKATARLHSVRREFLS